MSKRETDAVAKILSDPENSGRTAEEVAELVLDKLFAAAVAEAKRELREETRREIFETDAQARRLAVVGQITYGPQEETSTVVLGPFHAPLQLRDEERFRRALERPCTAARDAGGHLAWDSKTGRGSGRFMLAPAFMKPRDAWDFYRPERKPDLEHITESIARWQPGLWAEQLPAQPACICGMKGDVICRLCGITIERHCPRHESGAEIHSCRSAA